MYGGRKERNNGMEKEKGEVREERVDLDKEEEWNPTVLQIAIMERRGGRVLFAKSNTSLCGFSWL